MPFKLVPYEQFLKADWDFVLDNSAENLFLFKREFMEYHKDRFIDSSLMLFKDDKAIGIVPCNIKQEFVFSHQGLSFGGIILIEGLDQDDILIIIEILLKFWNQIGIKKVEIKLIPIIYCGKTQNSIKELLFEKGFKLQSSVQTFVIDMSTSHKSRVGRWKLRNSHRKDFQIMEVNDFSGFWNHVLIPLYHERIGVPPTHTVEEINQLKSRNQNHIRQFVISLSDHQILAGITVFEYKSVAKFQYIAATNLGKKLRALDFLMEYLLKTKFARKKYIDLGTVHDPKTGIPQKGLIDWKVSWHAEMINLEKIEFSFSS